MTGIVDGFIRGRQAALSERQAQADEERRQAMFARQQQDWSWLDGERAYQSQRRGVLDQRQDETYQFEAERRPIVAGQQDQQFASQMETGALTRELARNSDRRAGSAEARATEQAGQQRQRFLYEMRGAERNDRIQELQTRFGLNAAQMQAEQQEAQRAYLTLEQEVNRDIEFGREQDAAGKIAQFYNESIPNGDKVEIGKTKDGWVAVSENGQAVLLGKTAKEALDKARNLTDPDVYVELRVRGMQIEQERAAAEAKARAEHPERYSKGVQGAAGQLMQVDTGTGVARQVVDEQGQPVTGAPVDGAGRMPARLQEAEAVFSRLRPMPGESDTDRWLRAYELSGQSRGKAPEQAVRDFYQTTLGALVRTAYGPKQQEQAAARAEELTRQYEQRFFAGGQGAPSGAAGAAPAQDSNFDPDAFLNQF